MSQHTLAIECSPQLMQEVSMLGKELGIRLSIPVDKTSAADALNAPIGAEEARQILQLITAIFQSGTACIAFLAALKKLLASHPNSAIIVRDPRSGNVKGKITHDTSDEELGRITPS